jgi:hypothetical protein
LAPTKRKGRPAITNRLPRVRTNKFGRAPLPVRPWQLNKKAAHTASVSTAIKRNLFVIKKTLTLISLLWVCQSNKAHYRANRPEDDKQIEERQDIKRQTGVVSYDPKTNCDELNVKEK